MSEKRNLEVHVGTPATEQGEGQKDYSAPPKESEVGGRYQRMAVVICPHCGAHRQIVEDTNVTQWYTCGNCGGNYRY